MYFDFYGLQGSRGRSASAPGTLWANMTPAQQQSRIARQRNIAFNIALAGVGTPLLAGKLTTQAGFLIGGITLRTPFAIPVQRFGQIAPSACQHWGTQIGTNATSNRIFNAILPGWNPLTQYTTGVIPKGTQITFGIAGPQGGRYVGGNLQFVVPSRNVTNQTTKLIYR